MIAALPVLAAGYEADWSSFRDVPGARPVFVMGENFIRANGERSIWLLTLARWACIPFSLIGAWTCYQWTKRLAGVWAGFLASVLWCGSPSILGHGQLITPDVPAAAIGILACYIFWCWLQNPTWPHTLITGVLLGIAELTKTTLILFYFIWPVIWLVVRWRKKVTMSPQRWLSELSKLVIQMLISVYIINLGYGFEGSFQRLQEFQFISTLFTGNNNVNSNLKDTGDESSSSGNRFRGTWFGNICVPLPANYILGLDIQQSDFENFGRPSYLRGTFRETGWWYYYLYGFTVKVPLALWGLAIMAVILRFYQRCYYNFFDAEILLLAVPCVILVVASAKHGFTHHMRYVLPCFPFVICWIAATVTYLNLAIKPLSQKTKSTQRRQKGILFLTIWFWTSSITTFPHSLSYFNIYAGGPFGGPNHLLGSNIDWGQDLLFLKQKLLHLDNEEPVFIAYFGGANPTQLGITGIRPMQDEFSISTSLPLAPGYYAISVNLLNGDPWLARGTDKGDFRLSKTLLREISSMKRIGSAGYSIYIYYVPPSGKPNRIESGVDS
ncbi:ArnT family glycosyltransferase [Gimesia benthica]|nr:glycosyltransferase family 39 protein [Gimesia benthica]